MTSQQAQIQELLNSIDAVLSKTGPRLPWFGGAETEQQRQVLEQTRNYLRSLQQQQQSQAIATTTPSAPAQANVSVESAQQVLQAVLQEMSYLRLNVMQPMRNDVELLRQQRENLLREVRELEAQRQQYALPGQTVNQQQLINDFLQTLMTRLQDNLSSQVMQTIGNLPSQTALSQSTSESQPLLPGDPFPSSWAAAEQASLSPAERLAQLQQIQAQSDQLLLKLDSTLRVIFDSLQRNIQTYQDSLGQGLDKMHSLGQQGEAMFSTLIDRLAQQLGQEASNYLQSSMNAAEWREPNQLTPGATANVPTPPEPDAIAELISDDELDEIDVLLNELTSSTVIQPDLEDDLADFAELSKPSSRSVPPAAAPRPQAEPEFDWDALDLSTSPMTEGDEDLTIFQVDESRLIMPNDEDLTVFQINEDILAQRATASDDGFDIELGDFDNSLDLLDQITTGLTMGREAAQLEPLPETIDVEASVTEAKPPVAEEIDEVDELYNSLFGLDVGLEAVDLAEPPVDSHVADGGADLGADFLDELPVEDESAADAGVFSDQPASSHPAIADEAATDVTHISHLEAEIGQEADLDLERELFSGLADLSELEADSPEEPSAIIEASPAADPALQEPGAAPQSFEQVLFDEPVPEASDDETLLLDTAAAFAGGTRPIETITSLTDLITLTEQERSLSLPTTSDRQDEESYIAASPDEDLLVTEEQAVEAPVDFEIASETLQQLTADLSRLETEGAVADAAEADTPVSPEPAEQLVPEPNPTQEASPEFADIPLVLDAENVSPNTDLSLPLSTEAVMPEDVLPDGMEEWPPMDISDETDLDFGFAEPFSPPSPAIDDERTLDLSELAPFPVSPASSESSVTDVQVNAETSEAIAPIEPTEPAAETVTEPADFPAELDSSQTALTLDELTFDTDEPGLQLDDASLADTDPFDTHPLDTDSLDTDLFDETVFEEDLVDPTHTLTPPSDLEGLFDNVELFDVDETDSVSNPTDIELLEVSDEVNPLAAEDEPGIEAVETPEAIAPSSLEEPTAALSLDELADLLSDEPLATTPVPPPAAGSNLSRLAAQFAESESEADTFAFLSGESADASLEEFALSFAEDTEDDEAIAEPASPPSSNTFTLEGLGSLFEDLPPIEPLSSPKSQPLEAEPLEADSTPEATAKTANTTPNSDLNSSPPPSSSPLEAEAGAFGSTMPPVSPEDEGKKKEPTRNKPRGFGGGLAERNKRRR
ncbi:hypothetical protein ACQ4M4_13255 [Leptolyngbya sp. AN02str]|uniref:hypothetical protein n=1 Tax=Leptolyngbya sp. AN02str TaxID=3423363 RepID=UPI003D31BAB2